MIWLASVFIGTAVLIGIILALPCEACRRRRERLEAAYDTWRRTTLRK